jgi:hypothetical protein
MSIIWGLFIDVLWFVVVIWFVVDIPHYVRHLGQVRDLSLL